MPRYYLATTGLARFPEPGVANLPTPEEFLAEVGLSESDFAAARVALQQEIRAFRRPLSVALDGVTLPSPPLTEGGSGYQIDPAVYAATREPPSLQTWLAYANATELHLDTNGPPVADEIYDTPVLASQRYTLIELADRLEAALGDDYGDAYDDYLASLQAARGVGMADFLGGIGVSDQLLPADSFNYNPPDPAIVFNYTPETQFRVVSMFVAGSEYEEWRITANLEDVNCAVRGVNEAGDCSAAALEELRQPIISMPQSSIDGLYPFAGRFYYYERPENAERVYLLRPRPGATPGQPNSYDEIATIDVPEEYAVPNCPPGGGSMDAGVPEDAGPPPDLGPDMGSGFMPDMGPVFQPDMGSSGPGQYCVSRFAVRTLQPEAERRAAELLMPSAADCAAPQVDCAGTTYDARLPLEDSLTDDGDAFESSWRSYLVRARQAADRADELGRQAQGTQLEIELRAEAAIAEIQSICGSAISIAPLTAENVTSTCPDAGTPLEIARCLGEDTPGMEDLIRCLEASTRRPFVSLGSQELCIFHPIGEETQVCGKARDYDLPDQACPRQPTEDDPPTGCAAAGDGYVSVRISGADLLGLFSAPQLSAGTKAPPGFCDDVREARRLMRIGTNNLATRLAWWKVFIESDFFSASNARRIARGINWEARPGSFSSLRVGERTILTNGDIVNGPRASGVCAQGGFEENRCSNGRVAGSLFCDGNSCANQGRRQLLNARMVQAAVAARWLGQQTLEGFVVPWGVAVEQDDQGNILVSVEGRSSTGYEDTWIAGGSPYGRWSINQEDRQGYAACQAAASTLERDVMWVWRSEGEEPYVHTTTCPWDGVGFMTINSSAPFGETVSPLDPLNVENGRLVASETLRSLRDPARPRYFQMLGLTDPFHPSGCPSNVFGCDHVFPWFLDGVDGWALVGVDYYTRAMGNTFTAGQVFDALELICEADATSQISVVPTPRTHISADDLPDILNDLKYAADAVHGLANRMVFAKMPVSVVESLDANDATGTSGIHGEYGVVVAGLRAAMVDLSAVPEQMAAEVRRLERAVRSANEELSRLANIDVIDRNNYKTGVAEQANQCAQSLFAAAEGSIFSVKAAIAGSVRAAAQCAVNATNVQRLTRNLAANEAIADSNRALLILTAENVSDEATVNLRLLETRLRTSSAAIDQYLIQLDSMQAQADRALARALFLSTDEAGAILPVSRSLRTRHSAEHERYRRAERDAIRLSFLAKRAIEQRFGVRLADLTNDLSLVDRPAAWESTICEMDGIDFGQQTSDDPDENTAGQYTAGAVGDYVSLLESFVESYRHDFPFTDGVDVAVVSLRDDIQNIRALCEAPVGNLLYFSASLTEATDVQPRGWRPTGCFLESAAPGEAACISVAPVADIDGPPVGITGVANPMRLTFRPGHPSCPGVDCPCVDESGLEDPGCGWRPGATYSQALSGAVGLYRLSWYELAEADANQLPELSVRSASVAPAAQVQDIGSFADEADEVWTRRWRYVFVPTVQTIEVHVGPQVEYGENGNELMEPVVAGVMLERMPWGVSTFDPDLGDIAVPDFASTEDTLTYGQQVCEDTTGVEFRDRSWTYGCEELCDLGFQGSCPEDERTRYCYWETSFTVAEESIQRGNTFAASGFARGNFNYRIDSVAANVVGSASRQCRDANLPSTCYSAGYVPYSLEHFGPYTVLGHDGRSYDAPLYTGRIEHARALAAERYLSNPMSGADQALISQFTQGQMRGRPVTGTYRLRVWDEPGVNFNGIEDVQLVLGYRFWTRTN